MADDWSWIWYYDSAGAVQTQGFNIFAHTPDYILLLMILQRFNLEDLGFPSCANSKAHLDDVLRGRPSAIKALEKSAPATASIAPPDGRPRTRSLARQAQEQRDIAQRQMQEQRDSLFEVDGEARNKTTKRMMVDPTIHIHVRRPVLKGRRTSVFGAKDPENPQVAHVIKISWPQTTRVNEAVIVWKAYKILENKNHKEAQQTLPKVPAFKDFGLSTNSIRRCLRPFNSALGHSLIHVSASERKLRGIFEEEVAPLTYVSEATLAKAMYQCVQCACLGPRSDIVY